MFTQSNLKVDKRGRVRFTSNGIRFEVTGSGIKMYDRYRNKELLRRGLVSQHLTPKLVVKLYTAVELTGAADDS